MMSLCVKEDLARSGMGADEEKMVLLIGEMEESLGRVWRDMVRFWSSRVRSDVLRKERRRERSSLRRTLPNFALRRKRLLKERGRGEDDWERMSR